MTLNSCADLFEDDLDAVAARVDEMRRRAGVYPLSTEAQVVGLAS